MSILISVFEMNESRLHTGKVSVKVALHQILIDKYLQKSNIIQPSGMINNIKI